jgi:formate/nitrite transporter FocA (FNT family)
MVRRDRHTFGNVARLWSVVLIANLVGALLFAFVIARSGVLDPGTRSAIAEVARVSLSNGFGSGLLRGVFAGWLIAMLVWMLPAAKDMDVVVIVLVTWLVSVGGFMHIVAGAVSTFYLTLTGGLGWGESVTRFFAPALIGNIIGGVVLVTAIGHAQVTAGGGKQRR